MNPTSSAPTVTEYRRLWRWATALVVGAVTALIALAIALGGGEHSVVGSLALHALEGAVVGGLCDWFAVWKTYQTIEAKQAAIAGGLGRWVSGELLSRQVIRDQIGKVLDDPEIHGKLYRALDKLLGSRTELAGHLLRAWHKAEPAVVDFVTDYDLSTGEKELIGHTGEDPRVRHALRKCASATLIELVETAEFSAVVSILRAEVPWIARFLVTDATVRSRLTDYAARFRDDPDAAVDTVEEDAEEPPSTDPESPLPAILGLLTQAYVAFVGSWNTLSPDERRRAVEGLLEQLREPVLEAAAELIDSERDKLRQIDTLRDYPPVRRALDLVEARLDDDISHEIGNVVEDALVERAPADFRRMVENRTRSHLEWIRINGTALGLVLGALAGGLLELTR